MWTGEEKICENSKQKSLGFELDMNLGFNKYEYSMYKMQEDNCPLLQNYSSWWILQKIKFKLFFTDAQFGYCASICAFHLRTVLRNIRILQEK